MLLVPGPSFFFSCTEIEYMDIFENIILRVQLYLYVELQSVFEIINILAIYLKNL